MAKSALLEVIFGKKASGVAAFFKDDHVLLEAAHKTYAAGYRKFDSISPFPIHGMDDAMGLRRSKIPYVTFVFGLAGASLAILFQWYVFFDWPLNIGGKPYFSFPAYIPITFELTVLLGGLSTAGALIFFCRLPKVDPEVIDPALTCSKFALFVPENDHGFEAKKVEDFMKSIGATEVRRVKDY